MKQFVIAALAATAISAGAQPVYRCGSSYGQQPCPGARVVTDDPRTPADAARSAAATRDDWKRAEAMEKARLAQLRNAPGAVVIGAPEPVKTQARTHEDGTRPKAGKVDQFTAVSPRKAGDAQKPKKKKKKSP